MRKPNNYKWRNSLYLVKRVLQSNSIDAKETIAGAHVLISDSGEILLASSIKNIEKTFFSIYGDLLAVSILVMGK